MFHVGLRHVWLLVLLVDTAPEREGPRPRDTAPGCIMCHRFPERLSHPVGIRARRAGELPLDRQKRIVCLTCHDERMLLPHVKPPKPGATAKGHPHGLRQPAAELCTQCHDRREAQLASPLHHGLELRRAHLSAESAAASGPVDQESRICLGCHDGSIGRQPSSENLRSVMGKSHGIGRRYDRQRRRRAGLQLEHPSLLPAQIRLPDGRIGCGSCHSPYAKDKGMLVIPLTRSRLCMSCHRM